MIKKMKQRIVTKEMLAGMQGWSLAFSNDVGWSP
jgi:hypothetical protein